MKKLGIAIIAVLFSLTTIAQDTWVFDGGLQQNLVGDGTSWNDADNWYRQGDNIAGLPGADDIVIIDAGQPNCILDITPGVEFASVTVIAAGGWLIMNAGTVLDAVDLTVNDRFEGGTGVVNVSGVFTINGAYYVDFSTATYNGPAPVGSGGTYLAPIPAPAVPVSPWAVVGIFGIIAAGVYFKYRKRLSIA